MVTLIVPEAIAEQIITIAEREHHSVEAILAAMVAKYNESLSHEEIEARLRTMEGLTPPIDDGSEPPMTDEEAQELADLIGRPLSEIIIEERS